MITYSVEKKIFCLNTKNSSYIFRIMDNGELEHLYWGEELGNVNFTYLTKANPFVPMIYPKPDANNPGYSHNGILREYPSYGTSDYRNPAFSVQNSNGDSITNCKYISHCIYEGKEKVPGLPSTYSTKDYKCDTLEVTMMDKVVNLEVTLKYSVFYDYDIIVRSVKFTSHNDKDLILNKAMSMNVDFDREDFDIIHLPGFLMQERDVQREKITRGMKTINSRKGSSSHGNNPFLALCDCSTTESSGNAYGFNLVYSGNFETDVEVDELFRTRISMGINTETFSWTLKKNESFHTPENVMTFSKQGLNGMSQNLHRFYINNLFKISKDKPRPILFNHWEATVFNYNEKILRDIVDDCAELGVEMFVVDDGWFGDRNNDDTKSVGDWRVNVNRFPNGLDSFINYVNEKGLKFGIWFEPEMVSLDSDLYRAHPDWCMQVKDRSNSIGRNQLVLDLANPVVCDYIIKCLSDFLNKHNVEYVKWDMNRYHTEVGSINLTAANQKETAHRFILGLYKIMEELTNKFPNVLFEGCASGGGRFDPGILHYMSQIWTSDNTDPGARLKIQYGTSYAYPPIAMGSHISSRKGFSGGREAEIKTKFEVAFMGNLGLELNVNDLNADEKEMFKKYISDYKKYRPVLQYGTFYRLKNPNSANNGAWMTVSEDKKIAIVMHCILINEPLNISKKLVLQGLEENSMYKVTNASDVYTKKDDNPYFSAINQCFVPYMMDSTISGKQLMTTGLVLPNFPFNHDYSTAMWVLEKID